MTLPATGAISARDFNIELQQNENSPINMNNEKLRVMAGKTAQNSQISFSDLRGKSYFTYALYSQDLINHGKDWTWPSDQWYYSKGYKIVATAPSDIKLTRIKGYNDFGTLILDMPLQWGLSDNEYQLLTKPNRSLRGMDVDPDSIKNPGNTLYLSLFRIGYGNVEQKTIFRLVVVSDAGYEYELNRHRNFTLSVPYIDQLRMTQQEFFDRHPPTLVAQNI